MIVFTIGKVFVVWIDTESFWNYIKEQVKSRNLQGGLVKFLDYLSIVLFVGLVDCLAIAFLFNNLIFICLQFMIFEIPAQRKQKK